MTTSKTLLDFDKMVSLFALQFLGTGAFFVLTFFYPFFEKGIQSALLLTGVLSYEIILLTLVAHYVTKAKKTLSDLWERKRRHLYFVMAGVLVITYLLLVIKTDGFGWKLLREVIMVGLLLIGLPFVSDWFRKKNGQQKIQAD